jgi:DNA repair exonuclease SbcCD ATPase subunit
MAKDLGNPSFIAKREKEIKEWEAQLATVTGEREKALLTKWIAENISQIAANRAGNLRRTDMGQVLTIKNTGDKWLAQVKAPLGTKVFEIPASRASDEFEARIEIEKLIASNINWHEDDNMTDKKDATVEDCIAEMDGVVTELADLTRKVDSIEKKDANGWIEDPKTGKETNNSKPFNSKEEAVTFAVKNGLSAKNVRSRPAGYVVEK